MVKTLSFYSIDRYFIGVWLLCVVLGVAIGEQNTQAQILLPPPPKPAVPPSKSKVPQGQSPWEKHREEIKENEVPEPSPTEERDKELKIENEKPRDMRLMLQLSLVVPWIFTGENRHQYTTDLTSHFKAYYRLSSAPAENAGYFWTGFRLAPFAGTGIHGFTAGNYGFTYFGPAFGYGKITRGTVEKERGSAGVASSTIQPSANRQTWMVMGGVSMQSRTARVDGPADKAEEDFDSKPYAYDAPGTWLEASWGTIRWGGVSTETVTGVQVGSGKMFVWLGIGLAGWD